MTLEKETNCLPRKPRAKPPNKNWGTLPPPPSKKSEDLNLTFAEV